ncbi:Aste57867_21203 [Aphanomyces stellatus]|uniref:Aste57867_21203 protein n=1 Tax=Aphanomyces stellatus TaxID=120398 RepID=A0A485LJ11_9STRA|nr:hypothetical protein As57867_021135 [Aphanomyces stellatus]VFT97876.1 Aste57867_21203 [Aphanomyces stellatus]
MGPWETPTGSLRITTRQTAYADATDTTTTVVVETKHQAGWSQIQIIQAKGPRDGLDVLPYLWQVSMLDIPPGVVVEAFREPMFRGGAVVFDMAAENVYVRSFRVYLASSFVHPPLVTYATSYPLPVTIDTPVLNMGAGERVPSMVFAKPLFGKGLVAMDVPEGRRWLRLAQLSRRAL